MARASTPTKLPLATFAKYMGFHPLHFEQVVYGPQTHCDNVVFQHEWQTADKVSREEIARAIAEAEEKIENALGYRIVPSWEVDEWRATPQQISRYLNNHSNIVQASWGYMISGGIKSSTVVEAAADIVYTDEDSDGYFETATVTVTTVAVDPEEIHVFYPGKDGDQTWEIRPVEVVIASGTATITFRRELAVNPDLFDRLDIEDAEAVGTDDADFLSTVDVYRIYNDPQTQATLMWEPYAGLCGVCNGSGCESCAYYVQTACLMVHGDPRQSILHYTPADWDSEDEVFTPATWMAGRNPEIVRLYYYAGWRNKSLRYTNRMDPQWERTVAYMAAALLDRPPCDCVKGNWERWRQDLTLVAGSADGSVGLGFFRNPEGALDNPFGTTRGEVNAWRQVRNKIIGDSAHP